MRYNPIDPRTCPHCGIQFTKANKRIRFCSRSCGTSFNEAAKHIPTEVRFWSKVDKSAGPDGCWLWAGHICARYGYFNLTPAKHVRAHRLSWIIAFGEIPDGLFVCHHCDNPICVNPSHLFLGTPQDNQTDMKQKDRGLKGETHPMSILTVAQVLEIRERLKSTTVPVLATEYGVSRSTIYGISQRKHWLHV